MFMSPTYTVDAAQEIWRLLIEQKPFGLYHITNGGYCSWYEFACKILEYAQLQVEIAPVEHTQFPTRARRPLWSPLQSVQGIALRPWQEALKAFLRQIY